MFRGRLENDYQWMHGTGGKHVLAGGQRSIPEMNQQDNELVDTILRLFSGSGGFSRTGKFRYLVDNIQKN